jgi:hypothetical protein
VFRKVGGTDAPFEIVLDPDNIAHKFTAPHARSSAAKGGDMVAARIVLDRIVPSRRGRPVLLELGAATETSRDVSAILSALVTTMAAGEITPEEAATAASVIESKRRAIETVEIEERLKRLEKERAGGQI